MSMARDAPTRQKKPRKGESSAPVRTATGPPDSQWPPLLLLGILTAVLLAIPLVPGGPLAFLPQVLALPLAAAAVAGWWLKKARERCWIGDFPGFAPSIAEGLSLFLAFGTYLLLKLVGLHPSGTDDNIYFYMAHRMSQGAMPYRDFFFSHPPVHLLVPAAVFSVTGFSIGVAKSIPVLAQAGAGLFTYLTVRRASRPMAWIALVLHLMAYQVLMGSTDMNGENIMTAFLMAAVFCAVRGRLALSGVLAALGLGSGMYAFAAVLALAVAAAFTSGKAAARFGIGFGAALCAVFGTFWAIGGGGFIDGVFSYHLSKPVKGGERVPVFASANPLAMAGAILQNLRVYLAETGFKKLLYYHGPSYLWTMAAASAVAGRAVVALVASGRDGPPWYRHLTPRDMLSGTPEGLVKLCCLTTMLFFLQWSALNEIYDFYAVPMLALMAIPAAYSLHRVHSLIRDATRPRGFAVPVAAAGILALHVPWATSLNRSLWPEEQQQAGNVVSYEWREPWVLAGLAEVSRTLFFADSRVKGDVTPPYRHYVWNKMLAFSTVDEIADHIRANSAEDETITGASTQAPLVALYAGRRLAADEADTNSKRFKAGMITDREFFDMICRDRVRFIVGAPQSHFDDGFMAANPFVGEFFTRDRDFVDFQLKHFKGFPITLWRRVDRAGLPEGMVCEAR